MNAKIVMLPGGRWCLVTPQGVQSPAHRYEERIVFGDYVAQTEYWGCEQVWSIHMKLPHDSEDKSLG